jgi:probable phosphoglycerate mutase
MSDLQCPTTLILARHGEAEYESPDWREEGGSLTALGRRQAAALGESLAGRRVAHVWTSTLARAVQSAEIAAAPLGVCVTTRSALSEFGCGELAGAPRDTDPTAAIYAAWLAGELDTRMPGAECGQDIVTRMREVLCEIADAHRGETVLVISHGGALRLAVPTLARMDAEPVELDNCAAIEVEIDADDWVCRSWGPLGRSEQPQGSPADRGSLYLSGLARAHKYRQCPPSGAAGAAVAQSSAPTPQLPSARGASSSEWMSIRQPVRRAARRAFWPSLPIASDSW